MAIVFPCPRCGKIFQNIGDELAGKKGRCKQCGNVCLIPTPRAASSRKAAAKSSGDPFGFDEEGALPGRSEIGSGDTFGLDERPQPSPRRLAPGQDDDFAAPVWRPVKTRRKRSSGGVPGGEIVRDLFIRALAALAYFLVLPFIPPSYRVTYLILTVLTACGMVLYGWFGSLFVAFSEGIFPGLLHLFVPFYWIYYFLTRRAETRTYFLACATGAFILIGFNLIRMDNDRARQARLAQADRALADPGGLAPRPPLKAPGVRPPWVPLPAAPPAVPPLRDPTALTIVVTGIADRATGERVGGDLGAILETIPNHRLNVLVAGGRTIYTVSPVVDVEGFVRRISFGRVTEVRGRIVEVVADPIPVAAAPPERGGFDVAAPADARPPLGDSLDRILTDLQSRSLQTCKKALDELRKSAPNDRRAEVARAIEPLLKERDTFVRCDAIKALAVWGGPENVPALLDLFDDPEFLARIALFEALGTLRDPTAAGRLAEALSGRDRIWVAKSLIAIGPPAEAAVARALLSPDEGTRAEAAKILEEIGGARSVPDLRALAQRGAGFDSLMARKALETMSGRKANADPTATPSNGARTKRTTDTPASPFFRKPAR